MTSKRVALIVGCGSIGQRHARLLSERGDLEVWACDPIEKNLQEAQQKATISRTFADYESALREKPDFVWVCTPNRLHAPVAIAALEAGAHVFCEKPLADAVEAGQAICNAVQATGKTLMVGYTMRWMPGLQFIARTIREGRIGHVIGGRVRVHGARSLEVARSDYRRYERAALVLDYSHEIDYLRWFLGDVTEAKALSATLGNPAQVISPNVVSAVLRFAQGSLVSLHYDYIVRPGAREIEIFADNGMIRYNTNDEHLQLYVGQEGNGEKVYVKPADYDDPYRAEIQSFLDAAAGRCAPVVSAWDGLEVLKVVFAIVDSYEGGKM